jgi:hypothetical protein
MSLASLCSLVKCLQEGQDKQSSLLRKSVNYGSKKFYRIGPRGADDIKLLGTSLFKGR